MLYEDWARGRNRERRWVLSPLMTVSYGTSARAAAPSQAFTDLLGTRSRFPRSRPVLHRSLHVIYKSIMSAMTCPTLSAAASTSRSARWA